MCMAAQQLTFMFSLSLSPSIVILSDLFLLVLSMCEQAIAIV